jgi:ribosomal protein L20
MHFSIDKSNCYSLTINGSYISYSRLINGKLYSLNTEVDDVLKSLASIACYDDEDFKLLCKLSLSKSNEDDEDTQ